MQKILTSILAISMIAVMLTACGTKDKTSASAGAAAAATVNASVSAETKAANAMKAAGAATQAAKAPASSSTVDIAKKYNIPAFDTKAYKYVNQLESIYADKTAWPNIDDNSQDLYGDITESDGAAANKAMKMIYNTKSISQVVNDTYAYAKTENTEWTDETRMQCSQAFFEEALTKFMDYTKDDVYAINVARTLFTKSGKEYTIFSGTLDSVDFEATGFTRPATTYRYTTKDGNKVLIDATHTVLATY